MDFSLRCNSLKCRVQLNERAVVTTCSHIFCMRCSDNLGLSNATGAQRRCPACQTVLTNPDDVVATQLNPTEDYKTSVLSGLSPTAIMECAGRGLAFWSYQSTQEIVYQEYLAKTLTDKYGNLSLQMDKIIHDANSEIDNLGQKLAAMQVDHDKLRTENSNLVSAYREKSRKHQQTQELYDRLKRKEMTAVTQSAAYDSVDEVLQSASNRLNQGANGPTSYGNQLRSGSRLQPSMEQPPRDNHRAEYNNREHGSNGSGDSGRMMPPPNYRPAPSFGNRVSDPQNEINVTPSVHRTRLGQGLQPTIQMAADGLRNPRLFGNGDLQTPSVRRPLEKFNHNSVSRSGVGGYGMSAGLKVGRQQGIRLGPYTHGADENDKFSRPRQNIDHTGIYH